MDSGIRALFTSDENEVQAVNCARHPEALCEGPRRPLSHLLVAQRGGTYLPEAAPAVPAA